MAILSISFPLIISSFLRPHASPRFLHLPRYLPRSPYRRFHRTAVSSNVHHHPSHRKPDDNDSNSVSIPTFQQAIQRLQEYWASVGCAVMQPSNTEVGAGTMNPSTFLRVLGPEPWNVAYVEPSIRPDDSRYGENPNRLQRHTQFQVILKPDPGNSQDLFINSLSALGIDVTQHDIRFVEDNWESPVLGAWGLGWEIWMDGMEITQFTYFQQAGSLQLSPVSVEITYGLERILMLLQEVDHFKKILYADGITYGELFLENEKEMSSYYLEHASVNRLQKHFDSFDEEARSLLALGLPIPAYDQLLKTSHAFNILDARGFVGVTERARYFGRMRSLARQCAQLWLKTRESLGHPLGVASEHIPPIHHGAALENVAEKVPEDPRSFIIEIGTEEMPPPDVINASEQLRVLVVQLLENQRLRHGVVKAFGTPRRLVVLVDAMSPKQLEEEVEVRGPPASKAFDDQGNPTKTVLELKEKAYELLIHWPLDTLVLQMVLAVDMAFRWKNCTEKLTVGKTEYVHARVTQPARLALEVLSEELPGILAKISFPKSMRWNSSVMFSRPVRWVMALHGDLVVPFCFAGNTSGNVSFGLRNTASATLLERKKIILDKSNALAKSVNGRVVVQQNLLNEVANLVEAPVPLIGKFKESFLELPDELLTIVMQKHQKYFSITDESGKLLPYFIAVANGAINEDVVRKGNEAVLRARYEDAKFFYEVDTRKRFSEFRDQLKGILFHEKLGTMLDKMNRLEKMVTKLCLALEVDEDLLPVVEEAASLALSDLATSVVTEFTSLSGIMARHYALRDGYSEQIAEALLEITLPRFSGDVIPKTDAGMVLAIGDRLDSLVGLFAAGCQPSSTNDPFGLRRISYGLVQILVEKDKNVNFKHALDIAASVQPIKVEANTLDDVYQFVTRRLEQLLVDNGVSPEVVRSVLAERGNDPCLAARTAYKMEKLSKGEIFPKIVEAYSRPTRIVRGKDVDVGVEVDESVFETSQEKELWSIYTSIKDRIHSGIEEFTEISTQLVEPLEDFFNNVFVMVEEERVRKNRLALLNNIASLPSGIADLSFLPGF
ncbi:hypothetical protein Bca101_098882 [Brassica carinata]